MPRGFRWSSMVIGLASAFLLAFVLGCGNPPPPKPSSPAPSGKPKEESKESRPPNPDPG